MAEITEEVTTTEEVVYNTPVYRKITDSDLYIKIFSATEMIVITGTRSVVHTSFPNSTVRKISDTEESDDVEFDAARVAAVAALEAL